MDDHGNIREEVKETMSGRPLTVLGSAFRLLPVSPLDRFSLFRGFEGFFVIKFSTRATAASVFPAIMVTISNAVVFLHAIHHLAESESDSSCPATSPITGPILPAKRLLLRRLINAGCATIMTSAHPG